MNGFIRAILLLLFAAPVIGSTSQITSYNKQNDLIDGKCHQVSISSQGELMLAPQALPIFDSGRPFIWDMVIDDQNNIFVATGDEAKIYQIRPDGNVKIVAQWRDVEVYALSIDLQGNCYAGTSPDGKIYRIFSDKPAQLWSTLDAKYIWDIDFDQHNRCYVATGDSGAIYMIDAKGKPNLLFRSSETHIRCLSWDNNHCLLAGSYPHGHIYRIDSSGHPFVIYDAPYQEIHQICVSSSGQIYAAAMGQELSSGGRSNPQISDDLSRTSEFEVSKDSKKSQRVDEQGSAASGIIKIQPDGLIKDIWQPNLGIVQSLAMLGNGTVLVGSSDQGRLYQIDDLDEISFLMSLSASHLVALKTERAGKTYVGTSNLGKVFQLGANFESQGIYESKVLDAQSLAHWGKLHYEAKLPPGCSIKLYTRSGNTAQTNATWSSWVELAPGDNIASPSARFLQWKVALHTSKPNQTPVIKNIRLSYLQSNLPPEVLSITVKPVQRIKHQEPGQLSESGVTESELTEETSEDPSSAMKTFPGTGGRRPLPAGFRRVSWQARDRNNDRLVYELNIQSKDETNWRILKTQVTKNFYVWDSRLMPDGMYRLKIIADDKPSNPIQSAKRSEKRSDWFIIDNTGPSLDDVRVTKVTRDSVQIHFALVDSWSPIRAVEISIDMQNWLAIQPVDRINDTLREVFEFRIAMPLPRPQSMIVKAEDAAENASYCRIKLEE